MYSADDLLHLLHSDGADELRLHVGDPPIVILDGEENPVEGPPLSAENVGELFRSLTTTRQRREFRERGGVQFIYRFRDSVDFVVRATLDGPDIGIVIH